MGGEKQSMKPIHVFSGSSHPELAREVCGLLGVGCAKSSTISFSNENLLVHVEEDVRGCDTFVIGTASSPLHTNMMEIFILCDTLRAYGARTITAVIPYFPYIRSDKQDRAGVAVVARLVASLLETSGATSVLLLDLHAPQEQGFFRIPAHVLTARHLLADHLRTFDLSDAVLVSPDAGEVKDLEPFTEMLNLPMAVIDKRRVDDTETPHSRGIVGDVEGRTAILIDDEIASAGTVEALVSDVALLRQAKEFGYSDRQLAFLLRSSEETVTRLRKSAGVVPVFGSVDTCAGEFEAVTPYYYSTYPDYGEAPRPPRGKATIMVLGGGPNRIGQGIEFDYCCCHAAFALRKAGYEVVMVNSNPETVSTDYDTSDKLYFEPLTLEDVMHIYERERCSGVIVQFGGQTPLNLAEGLKRAGARVLGTTPEDITMAEDRDEFEKLAERIGIRQPANGIAHTVDEALAIASRIGYPVLVRPSFVLGGRGMVIVHQERNLRQFVAAAVAAGGGSILIDRFLENAVELDVDCISDGETTVIGAILEHVEPAGIHSGDSASVTPPMTLSPAIQERVRRYAHDFARELHVCGLMNMQLAVKDGELYMIEVNPRASRTVPFVSKAIGVSLPGLAARCMVGERLRDLGFVQEVRLPYIAVKEAVFPFVKFPGVDVVLSPEMKSTGEVMSLDRDRGLAYLKSQIAAGNRLPSAGNVFLSVKDADKPFIVDVARQLQQLGFTLYATRGTSTLLYDHGIRTRPVFKISQGRPNLLDFMRDGEIQWVINTTEPGEEAMVDEVQMRSQAVASGIPITTTLAGVTAAIEGLADKMDFGRFEVCSLQEYHRHLA